MSQQCIFSRSSVSNWLVRWPQFYTIFPNTIVSITDFSVFCHQVIFLYYTNIALFLVLWFYHNFTIKWIKFHLLLFFFNVVFIILEHWAFHQFFTFQKKSFWDFQWNWIKIIDKFEKTWHFYDIYQHGKSLNLHRFLLDPKNFFP